MRDLADWESFYVITGSAAGALIGLQFVVMTLLSQGSYRATRDAGAAFSTPTTVYFGTALLLAALLRAPWHAPLPPIVLWGAVGFAGLAYGIATARRMHRLTAYRAELEDWAFHCVLPLLAYVVLTLSAFTASSWSRESLFAVGGTSLLLLFVGIHNAWDAVTWHVLSSRRDGD